METEATQKALNGGPEGGEPAPKSADDANAAQAPAVTPRHTPRDRKPVNFYKPEETTRSSLKIEQGKGMKLRDIPNAHFKLSKLKSDDELVTGLHALIYKRQGTGAKRKKNIFEFSGFAVSDDEAKSVEEERMEEKLSKWTMALLNRLLDCFGLPRGTGEAGQKASKISRVVQFLMEPKIVSSKNMAEEAAKKKALAKKGKPKQPDKDEKKQKQKVQKRKLGGEAKPKGRAKKAKTGSTKEEDKAAKEEAKDAREEENDAKEEEKDAKEEDKDVEDTKGTKGDPMEAEAEGEGNGLTEGMAAAEEKRAPEVGNLESRQEVQLPSETSRPEGNSLEATDKMEAPEPTAEAQLEGGEPAHKDEDMGTGELEAEDDAGQAQEEKQDGDVDMVGDDKAKEAATEAHKAGDQLKDEGRTAGNADKANGVVVEEGA